MTWEEDKEVTAIRLQIILWKFFTYSTYEKDILMVSIPIDSNKNLQAGTYRITLQIQC